MKAVIRIYNPDLGKAAMEAATEENLRLKNWLHATPSIKAWKLGDYTTESFQYRGHFRGYQGCHYIPRYTSYLVCDNVGAVYTYGFLGQMKTRKLRAPAGCEWDHDGSLVLRSDYNVEYHPTCEDLVARDFGRRIKAALREARTRRAADLAAKAALEREQAVYEREVEKCRVTVQDSRLAGNCVEGTLQFAERVLHIPREEVVSGQHLFSVPASRVLGHSKQADAACRVAFMRETTVSI